MLLERLRRFCQLLLRIVSTMTPTNQSHLRPYGGGSASEARFNEERADLSTRIEGVSPPGHHPFLRLSTNAGNVSRRNSSCGGNSAETAHTSTREHSASGV